MHTVQTLRTMLNALIAKTLADRVALVGYEIRMEGLDVTRVTIRDACQNRKETGMIRPLFSPVGVSVLSCGVCGCGTFTDCCCCCC